jgi:hypothetical protein
MPPPVIAHSGDGHRTRRRTPVDKVYLVMLSEVYLLESGETWENIVVNGVFMSRNVADEHINYHEPSLPLGDRYFIREELVMS